MRTFYLIAGILLAIFAVGASAVLVATTLGADEDALHRLVGMLYADESAPLNGLAPCQSEANHPMLKLAVQPPDDGTEFSLNA